MSSRKVAVLGAGSWGIATANLLCRNGHDIILWEFDPAACDSLKTTRKLPSKLPGIDVEDRILITNSLEEALREAEFVSCVVPAQKLRATVKKIAELKLNIAPLYINLSKGIEVGSLRRMSEVIAEEIDASNRSGICTLSGPSHAEEVARGIPTVITAASEDNSVAEAVQTIFTTPVFRVYTSTDILGVELAGSLKNVIALAAGMLDGLGMGDNTQGALLTRGLVEIARVGVKMGADPLTFSGLSGVGDLVTTCLSRHSRNRFVGEQIGKGRKLKDVIAKMPMIAEGVATTESAFVLAGKLDVEIPITTEVYKVLFEEKSPRSAINDLMTREPKSEDF
ncbi:MAG: NAD(P)H-dependent glycerol-3-phosphate dehydrogenase [candidate division Zixibacteria bacterium]